MTNLITRWGQKIDPRNIHSEYPRPRMFRDSYFNLNGEWEYAITKSETTPAYEGTILVPFSPESELSGVNRIVEPDDFLHYRRYFSLPNDFKQDRIILHFGAVDQECEIFLNDISIGKHVGGYLPFSFDVTKAIYLEMVNCLEVRATDQTEFSPHARGKQKLYPKGKMDALFYTPSSGIWKSVWLECVPSTYITEVKVTPNYDKSSVNLHISTNKKSRNAQVEILFNYDVIETKRIPTNTDVTIPIESFKAWTPDTPHLYDVKIRCQNDQIFTYFGMRKFSKRKDANGIYRFYLNNKPIFINGLLDQGYWPESLMTPPSDEALKFDILETKNLGFNTIRKHVKIESERFYYHCDRLGMLVIQDMPNGGDDLFKPFTMYLPNVSDRLSRKINDNRYNLFGRSDAGGRVQYRKDLAEMVTRLYNHPSIAMWVPFNEGWGQFDANEMSKLVKNLDPTRFIAETSGWFDQGGGDVYTIHNYLKKLKVKPQPERVVALMEFGGYAFPVENHLPSDQKFGYRSYQSEAELTKHYRELWQTQIMSQIPNGLSAAIYTQTTDIEGEINGLFTYDREVLKIHSEIIQRINQSAYNIFNSVTQ